MAKRGQRFPYRLDYVWDEGTGTRGTIAKASADDASLEADRIEAAALAQGRAITLVTRYLPTAGSPGVAIETRALSLEDVEAIRARRGGADE